MRCTNTSLGGLALCETVGVAWAGGTKAHIQNSALGRDARVASVRLRDFNPRQTCHPNNQFINKITKVKVKKYVIMAGTAVNLKFITQENVEGNVL